MNLGLGIRLPRHSRGGGAPVIAKIPSDLDSFIKVGNHSNEATKAGHASVVSNTELGVAITGVSPRHCYSIFRGVGLRLEGTSETDLVASVWGAVAQPEHDVIHYGGHNSGLNYQRLFAVKRSGSNAVIVDSTLSNFQTGYESTYPIIGGANNDIIAYYSGYRDSITCARFNGTAYTHSTHDFGPAGAVGVGVCGYDASTDRWFFRFTFGTDTFHTLVVCTLNEITLEFTELYREAMSSYIGHVFAEGGQFTVITRDALIKRYSYTDSAMTMIHSEAWGTAGFALQNAFVSIGNGWTLILDAATGSWDGVGEFVKWNGSSFDRIVPTGDFKATRISLGLNNAALLSQDGVDYIACAIPSTDEVYLWKIDYSAGAVTPDYSDIDLSGALTVEPYTISTTGEATPWSIQVSPDGKYIWDQGSTLSTARRWTMADHWDIQTASSNETAAESNVRSIRFAADGSKMFVLHRTAGIREYNLPTPWSMVGRTLLDTYYAPGTPDVRSLHFSNDGFKMFWGAYASGTIRMASLSTAWDISTRGAVSSASFGTGAIYDFFFTEGGKKMFVFDQGALRFKKYLLSTEYDITAASLDSSIAAMTYFGVSNPYGLWYDENVGLLYFTSYGSTIIKYAKPDFI